MGAARGGVQVGVEARPLRTRSSVRRASFVLLALLALVWVGNTSLLAPPADHRWGWLAHRGVAQSFSLDGVDADTCTARRIHPPSHGYLENTLPSMREAFRRGAAVVELDLHRSRDGVLVVFHDATLECRTDGAGAPEDHDLAELRALDVGYGYTADGGATFPLRGTGVGAMPTLIEVLDAFPDRALLLHLKSNDPRDGELLAEAIAARPGTEALRFVYGGAAPVARVTELVPEVRTFDKDRLKRCALGYVGTGWAGWVPDACRSTLILVPSDLAPLLWGWPRRFEARMEAGGTRVVLTGPRSDGGWISGIDTPAQAAAVPEGFGGWVWTNRIDLWGE